MSLSIAPLFSGSKGNCILVASERTKVLVDAGFSCTRVEAEAKKAGICLAEVGGILVTHEHTDHIAGVGVISRKYDIPVYANEETWMAMVGKSGEVAAKNIRVIDDADFYIDDLCIQPFDIPHDAARPFGYSVSAGGKKIAVMTDLGHVTDRVLRHAQDANIVLLESNHDIEMLKCGPYPYPLKQRILSTHGHLSNEDAAKTALKLAFSEVRGILLGHLSQQNNFPELAYQTVCDYLGQNGVVVGRHVAVAMTRQDGMTGFYEAK